MILFANYDTSMYINFLQILMFQRHVHMKTLYVY